MRIQTNYPKNLKSNSVALAFPDKLATSLIELQHRKSKSVATQYLRPWGRAAAVKHYIYPLIITQFGRDILKHYFIVAQPLQYSHSCSIRLSAESKQRGDWYMVSPQPVGFRHYIHHLIQTVPCSVLFFTVMYSTAIYCNPHAGQVGSTSNT